MPRTRIVTTSAFVPFVEDGTFPHLWQPATVQNAGAWKNACLAGSCAWGQSRPAHATAALALAARPADEAQHNAVLAGFPLQSMSFGTA